MRPVQYPPFPELPDDPARRRETIHNWLAMVHSMGFSQLEARAALALMDLRVESHAVLDREEARRREQEEAGEEEE
jgi:hypothetical protein